VLLLPPRHLLWPVFMLLVLLLMGHHRLQWRAF